MIKGFIDRIKKREFSESSKQAVKNSFYTFLTSVVSEIGAIIFTIAIARLLMPELFGLYNLALSTILIFASFSNLGLQETIIKFLSNEIGKKKNNKAWSLIKYLGKIRIIVTFIFAIILLLFANIISTYLYNKPITLALIVGVIYLILANLSVFLQSIFVAFNNIKIVFYKEIIFQVSRALLVPLGVLFLIKYYSNGVLLGLIFLFLSISYLFTDLYMTYSAKKQFLIENRNESLSKNHKQRINKFLILTSTIALSGIFFSYVDRIILGHFVNAAAIGYYSAAFGVIGSVAGLVTFGTAFLPIFSRTKGKELDKVMKRTILGVLLISTILWGLTLLLSPLIISLVFGNLYLPAEGMLKILSLLIILLPLTSVYLNFFLSIEKPKTVAKILLMSTIVNIILTSLFVYYLLNLGDIIATYGASIGIVLSQIIYLFSLYYTAKRMKKSN